MKTKTIRDPRVMHIHRLYKELRNDMCTFFNSPDFSLIRFSFSESIDEYIFKVKFTSTHKLLKFYISQNTQAPYIQFQQFEKTRNIVEDIDCIYHVKRESQLRYMDPNFNDQLLRLFMSGLQLNGLRQNEVFKAEALQITSSRIADLTSTDKLYFDIIEYHNVENIDVAGLATVKIKFLGNNSLTIRCPEDQLDRIQCGKIFFINYKQRFSVMTFTSAKHHVKFTEAQYNYLSQYQKQRVLA